MQGDLVPIARVFADFLRQSPGPDHISYRVVLKCGCVWWEDLEPPIVAPRVGQPRRCVAPDHHHQPFFLGRKRLMS